MARGVRLNDNGSMESPVYPSYAERSWALPQKGKFKRQLAILDAARAILKKSGKPDFTMREVATQAGVSLATPYNLFGSKQSILQAIYEEDSIEFSEFFGRKASRDAIPRIFDAIDLSIEYYKSDPEFYRALLTQLCQRPTTLVGIKAWSPQIERVSDLVGTAVALGDLRPDTPVRLISSSLIRMFRAIGQEWLDGLLSLDQMRDEIGAFFTIVLGSLASKNAKKNLEQIATRYSRATERSGCTTE